MGDLDLNRMLDMVEWRVKSTPPSLSSGHGSQRTLLHRSIKPRDTASQRTLLHRSIKPRDTASQRTLLHRSIKPRDTASQRTLLENGAGFASPAMLQILVNSPRSCRPRRCHPPGQNLRCRSRPQIRHRCGHGRCLPQQSCRQSDRGRSPSLPE